MKIYRVDLVITVDVEAENIEAAEIKALEVVNTPGMNVANCEEIGAETGQQELFE
jgi:hypothetical protein